MNITKIYADAKAAIEKSSPDSTATDGWRVAVNSCSLEDRCTSVAGDVDGGWSDSLPRTPDN
ncbi:hypothetical protein [Pseudomonas entomophila]|uniref:hypothetical protein n=1 Tax=Pseudomonas entomophila TaxID=312306 RepID=UPI003EBD56D7